MTTNCFRLCVATLSAHLVCNSASARWSTSFKINGECSRSIDDGIKPIPSIIITSADGVRDEFIFESPLSMRWDNELVSSSSYGVAGHIEWAIDIGRRFSVGLGCGMEYAYSKARYNTMMELGLWDDVIFFEYGRGSWEMKWKELSPEVFAHVEARIWKGLSARVELGLARTYMRYGELGFSKVTIGQSYSDSDYFDLAYDAMQCPSALRTRLSLGLEWELNPRWTIGGGVELLRLGDYELIEQTIFITDSFESYEFSLPITGTRSVRAYFGGSYRL